MQKYSDYYYVGYVKLNSVKYLYLIINKMNGYIAESNGNKYLAVVNVDESKDTLEKVSETIE